MMQLWFYKVSFIVSDHGSRRTGGPGPLGSGFGTQKGDPPTKSGVVFAKMHGWGSRGTPHPLYAPRTRGGGGTGSKPPPRTFPPSRTTSMPNFVLIHPAVWNKHTHTHCPLCIRLIQAPAVKHISVWPSRLLETGHEKFNLSTLFETRRLDTVNQGNWSLSFKLR